MYLSYFSIHSKLSSILSTAKTPAGDSGHDVMTIYFHRQRATVFCLLRVFAI